MFYKDLEVWKKAIDLTILIYQITEGFPDEEKYGIISQIRRAVVAIPSNIAEGSSRMSDKDTMKFIDIAIGSLAELDTQMIIAEKLNYYQGYEQLKIKIDKLFALLRGFKNYLKNNLKRT